MTNEEKAKEIGNINSRQYRHNYGDDEFVFSNEECTQSALEMAEWKDQHFKEFLEKKRGTIEFAVRKFGGDLIKQSKVLLLTEIINELSKED